MPTAPKLKPTIYFRGGFWRVRQPMPHPYNGEPAGRWLLAHTYIHQLNQRRLSRRV